MINKIICFIKTIIRCLTPKKEIEYYKHQKTLVGVDEELVPLSNKDELVVPNKKYIKMMAKELEKYIKEGKQDER